MGPRERVLITMVAAIAERVPAFPSCPRIASDRELERATPILFPYVFPPQTRDIVVFVYFQGGLDAFPGGLRRMEEDELMMFAAAFAPIGNNSSSPEFFQITRIPKAANCYERRTCFGEMINQESPSTNPRVFPCLKRLPGDKGRK